MGVPRGMTGGLAAGLALAVVAALPAWVEPAQAKEEAPAARAGDQIDWVYDLAQAFERAKARNKVLMICINSRLVDQGRLEPAAKGLREVVYKDPRVVQASRQLVCAFLSGDAGSADYGVLRKRFGIDGMVVSPQHIFAHPEHEQGEPLVRLEYWPYGQGDGAVTALLDLIEKAQAKFKTGALPPQAPPPAAQVLPPVPQEAEQRPAWIAKMVEIIRAGGEDVRAQALQQMRIHDQNRDCLGALCRLLPELQEDDAAARSLLRALSVPGLQEAVEPVALYLEHKNVDMRAEAAVTLEYVGVAPALVPLDKALRRERNESVTLHLYRALGRCGAGEEKVRSRLCRYLTNAQEKPLYALLVALAYFEGNPKAARAVEKVGRKLGPPTFGSRGDRGRSTLPRSMVCWCLAEIGDPKSAEFVQDVLLDPLENARSPWIGPVKDFYEATLRACRGDTKARTEVDAGVARVMSLGVGNPLWEETRSGRDGARFRPKGDWEIAESS